MAWLDDWTRPKYPVDENIITKAQRVLTDLIQSNGGSWTGKIVDIAQACGLNESWYGTLYNALPEARRRAGIAKRNRSRLGNEYFFDKSPVAPEHHDTGARDAIRGLKFMLGGVDPDKATSQEMDDLLRLIRRLVCESGAGA